MEHHNFCEIYEVGGSSMQDGIEMLLASTNDDEPSDAVDIKPCVDYLLSLDDCDYKRIYLSIPVKLSWLDDNTTKIDGKYTSLEIAEAIITDIKLLQKSQTISLFMLNNVLHLLANMRNGPINLSTDMCKSLRECGCTMSDLYSIISMSISTSTSKSDYDTLNYVINNLNAIEIAQILRNDEYMHLPTMLLIDKIYAMQDDGLKMLTENIILLSENHSLCLTLLQCYIIIRYKTTDEGKALLTSHNEKFEALIKKHKKDEELVSNTTLSQTLFNDILNFHLRPRGAHTKAPSAF
jgi:hypothetical protein